jgi:hypothetical protein
MFFELGLMTGTGFKDVGLYENNVLGNHWHKKTRKDNMLLFEILAW